jgi:hypothetical protein
MLMNNRPVSVTAAVLLVLPQFVIAIAARSPSTSSDSY